MGGIPTGRYPRVVHTWWGANWKTPSTWRSGLKVGVLTYFALIGTLALGARTTQVSRGKDEEN